MGQVLMVMVLGFIVLLRGVYAGKVRGGETSQGEGEILFLKHAWFKSPALMCTPSG